MDTARSRKLRSTLKDVFGLEKLRPMQREVIGRVLDGENVLAIMPTGGGKSLCYQLPALHLPGMTIVVAPLISLAKDQSDKLEEKGLDAANLNSAVSASEQREALEDVEQEESDFIFTTPERLTNPQFIDTVRDKEINLVVIDEAHCISNWGHDFRPAFLGIKQALKELGNPAVLALTATATPSVVDDIKTQLGRDLAVVHGGIYRPNLRFEVIHTTNDIEKRTHLRRLLNEIAGTKIVYCATTKAVDEVTGELKKSGVDVDGYHGKRTVKQRNEVQDRFMSGELETIVATNAFGMGVDKPDIRAVIHWQMPGSLEAYYQEAGRAGRDGDDARCVLLYDTRDRRVQQYFLGGRYPSPEEVTAIYKALAQLDSSGITPAKADQVKDALDQELALTKVRVALNLLKEEKVVKERRGSAFELIDRGLSDDDVERIAQAYVERGRSDRDRLERMMLYAQSGLCRWQAFIHYFQTTEPNELCGTCDNCVSPPEERLGIAQPPVGNSKADDREVLDRLKNGDRKAKSRSFSKGDIVILPKTGEAEVRAVTDDKIEVVLPGGDVKTFKKEFARRRKRK
jgi:ATP-dependent DNA helicase RecQ